MIGVVLLWVSNAWNVRDKLIGTLLWPGGLGLPVFLFLASTSLTSGHRRESCQVDPATGQEFNCVGSSDSIGVMDVLGIVLMIAVLITPVVTTAYLAYRLRRGPAAAAA